jgi:hypothetical protein
MMAQTEWEGSHVTPSTRKYTLFEVLQQWTYGKTSSFAKQRCRKRGGGRTYDNDNDGAIAQPHIYRPQMSKSKKNSGNHVGQPLGVPRK